MSLHPTVRVDVFQVAGTFTWNKFVGAKWVKVQLQGGGSGGQTAPNGGGTNGAGAGGGFGEIEFPAAGLGSTESVVVGAGGAAGILGGFSAFGRYVFVRGGAVGGAGGSAGSGYPNPAVPANANAGFMGNSLGTFGTLAYTQRAAANGGAAGGVAVAGTAGFGSVVASAAANPGSIATGALTGLAGGAGGAAAGGNGGDGLAMNASPLFGGSGGGGGGGSVTVGS